MTLARIRVPLGFAAGALVLYLAAPTPASLAAGLPIGVAGLLFRAAAAGVIRKNRALAMSGPYRFTRHPLYFGSFLLAVGFAVMSWSLAAAAILLVPFAVVYRSVIRREDARLAELFAGEYDAFSRAVPRFFPRRLDIRLFEPFVRSQYISNREYNAALGFIAATAILVFKCWY